MTSARMGVRQRFRAPGRAGASLVRLAEPGLGLVSPGSEIHCQRSCHILASHPDALAASLASRRLLSGMGDLAPLEFRGPGCSCWKSHARGVPTWASPRQDRRTDLGGTIRWAGGSGGKGRLRRRKIVRSALELSTGSYRPRILSASFCPRALRAGV